MTIFHSAFSLFKIAGTVAGAMTGAGLVTEGARRVLVPRLPVLAGPLDQIGTLLDPLDLTGMRAKKAREEQEKLAKAQSSSKSEKDKRKAAEKAATKAEKRADAAEKEAKKLREEARKAQEGQRSAEARAKAAEAAKKERWAMLSRQAAFRAKSTPDSDKGLALAAAALELASNAKNPPRGPQDALTSDMTDAAKSLVTDLVDAVNRFGDGKFDADQLVDRMARGDASAYEDMVDVSLDVDVEGPAERGHTHAVEGCCSSCTYGLGCAGKGKGMVPDSYVSGMFDGDDDEDDDDALDDEETIYSLMAGPSEEDSSHVMSGPAERLEADYDGRAGGNPFSRLMR